MSILIKGMEMPKEDGAISIYKIGEKFFAQRVRADKLCPLIEVPEPHGRLGDLDELHNHLNEWYLTHEHGFSETEKIYISAMLSGVKDSPTVIPAEEET